MSVRAIIAQEDLLSLPLTHVMLVRLTGAPHNVIRSAKRTTSQPTDMMLVKSFLLSNKQIPKRVKKQQRQKGQWEGSQAFLASLLIIPKVVAH